MRSARGAGRRLETGRKTTCWRELKLGQHALLVLAHLRKGGTGEATMQKVEVQFEDDVTGGPADETVEFSVGGKAH